MAVPYQAFALRCFGCGKLALFGRKQNAVIHVEEARKVLLSRKWTVCDTDDQPLVGYGRRRIQLCPECSDGWKDAITMKVEG